MYLLNWACTVPFSIEGSLFILSVNLCHTGSVTWKCNNWIYTKILSLTSLKWMTKEGMFWLLHFAVNRLIGKIFIANVAHRLNGRRVFYTICHYHDLRLDARFRNATFSYWLKVGSNMSVNFSCTPNNSPQCTGGHTLHVLGFYVYTWYVCAFVNKTNSVHAAWYTA